eukprot:scaffold5371_cov148-Prasinococcus_capsulatus_cf.AAC.1
MRRSQPRMWVPGSRLPGSPDGAPERPPPQRAHLPRNSLHCLIVQLAGSNEEKRVFPSHLVLFAGWSCCG